MVVVGQVMLSQAFGGIFTVQGLEVSVRQAGWQSAGRCSLLGDYILYTYTPKLVGDYLP